MNGRAAFLVGLLAACRERAADERPVAPWSLSSTPAADEGDDCADLAEIRVCFRGEKTSVVARAVPALAAPTPLGFRCVGMGPLRRCVDRALSAPPFVCDGHTCTQAHPRLPDEGPWSCTAPAGVVVCVGQEAAAAATEFRCGTRKNTTAPDRRVCVDLDPDFPDGSAHHWRCWFEHEKARRVCVRDPMAAALGDACDTGRPCVDGASCVSARCVPNRPVPACALDEECAGGRCRFGSCVGART